ncbi:MAG: glycosyltransferase [Pseudomonadota bacterium]
MTQRELDISICIANYNGGEVLGPCLASVFGQETTACFEVLVHDDASTDGQFDRIVAGFPEAAVLKTSSNIGYCQSNHRMADLAKGRLLLLLNNDVELMPGALETLWRGAQRFPDAVLSLAEYTVDGALSCRGMGLDIFFTPFHCRDPAHKAIYAMGACLLLQRDLWQRLGGYPRDFEYSGEDLYLCLAARAAGSEVRILGEGGYRHRISHSTNSDGINPRRRAYSERNRAFILRHMLPTGERLLITPLFYLMFCLERAWLRHRFGARANVEIPALKPRVEPQVPLLGQLALRPSKLLHLRSER